MITNAPPDYQCPFCRMAAAQFDGPGVYSKASDVVYRDAQVFAIIALHQWPAAQPNVLVIPVDHYEHIYTLPPELGTPLARVAQAVALAMKAVYNCDGVSTRQHNEPAGNQDVWHYHLHVTARYQGDDLYRTLAMGRAALMPPEERATHAARLRDHWSDEAR